MTGQKHACPKCAADVGHADRFCESCGTALSKIRRVTVPRSSPSLKPCFDCGNDTFTDGYCTRCGHRRAESDRDEADLEGAVLITDRGIEHTRNEDAAAAGALVDSDGRSCAIAVAVCDGVSTSGDPHTAAVAAATAGVDAMLTALAAATTGRAAVLAGLASAAKAAAAAKTGQPTAPACTYTGAAVVPTSAGLVQIAIGNVGDSRAYWLPEPPAPPRQLTVDDSLGQQLITAGAAAESPAVQASAHVLTRWLGADAGSKPWSESCVHTICVEGSGSLLMCTDGLWNYLPDAADIARRCTGTDATATARALVEHALQAGGQDNITVAVIPIGGHHEFS